MARVRAKRTEWRMRGIEPNKNVTSFSPHPSCLRDASAIHLPARSIATSPLWLKTVTCGLFLRCFTPPRRAPEGGRLNRLRTRLTQNTYPRQSAPHAPSSVAPRRAPEGEGLIGCVVILSVSNAVVAITRIISNVHSCHSGASVEKSQPIETARCIYAPAYPPAVAHRREIPCNRNENKRTRIPPNACQRRLCAPRRLTAEKAPVLETETIVHDYPGISSAASRHTAWVGQEDSPHIFICSGLRAW